MIPNQVILTKEEYNYIAEYLCMVPKPSYSADELEDYAKAFWFAQDALVQALRRSQQLEETK